MVTEEQSKYKEYQMALFKAFGSNSFDSLQGVKKIHKRLEEKFEDAVAFHQANQLKLFVFFLIFFC